jgi:hypothetical protein
MNRHSQLGPIADQSHWRQAATEAAGVVRAARDSTDGGARALQKQTALYALHRSLAIDARNERAVARWRDAALKNGLGRRT